MRKLRLDLDELVVESLVTDAGRVRGHQDDDEDEDGDGDRPPFDTIGDIPTCIASECATCDTCVGPNCPA